MLGGLIVFLGFGIKNTILPFFDHLNQTLKAEEPTFLSSQSLSMESWKKPKDLNPQDQELKVDLDLKIEKFTTSKKKIREKGIEQITYAMRVRGNFRELLLFQYSIDTSRANLTVRKAIYQSSSDGERSSSDLTLVALRIPEQP